MSKPHAKLREELGPGYELFMVALTTLSLVNIVILFGPFDPDIKQVAGIVDIYLSLFFLADFLGRLYFAEPWQDYVIGRQGYLDLLGSLPLPVVRIFRVVRLYRSVQRVRSFGGRKIVRRLALQRAQTALLFASFLVILILEVGSMLVVNAERASPEANIRNGGDALWWAIVSVATVGYGDKYPVTATGRIVGVFMIIGGVGLFGVFTGYVARIFLTPADVARRGEPGGPEDTTDAE